MITSFGNFGQEQPRQYDYISLVSNGHSNVPPVPNDEWIAQYPLASGEVVRFRSVRPEDEPLIAEAIRTASRETLLHRFFSPIRTLPPDLLRKLLAIDRSREVCLVGVILEPGPARIICGARYIRSETKETAEIAITVHDDFQRRGLGSFLFKLLVRIAKADGIRRFEADVMTSNAGMLKLLRKLDPKAVGWHRTGDIYHVTLDLV